jgi:hypothetical protein
MISAFLAAALVLTTYGTAFAAWPQYQGGGDHNGQITNGAPPTAPTAIDKIQMGGGVNTESVMNTENNVTYAYTFDSSGTLTKTNCVSRQTVWQHTFPDSSGYQLGSPALIADGSAYEGVYVGVTGYYELLQNPQFETSSDWTYNGAAKWNPETHQVDMQEGGSIEQTFTFTGSTGAKAVELFSQVKLLTQSATPGATTYTLADASGTILYTYVANPDSDTTWTNVEDYGSITLTNGTAYTIKVEATSLDVTLHHVDFSWQTAGVSKVSLNADPATGEPTVTPIAASQNGGQANTPITVYPYTDGSVSAYYLYYGTLSGYTNNYNQINLADDSAITYSSGNREYWAGAVRVTINSQPYMVFGSDGGFLHVSPVNNFSGGVPINLSTYVATDPGNVRSTVSTDGVYVYFTSQGGYLWRGLISSLTSGNPDITPLKLYGDNYPSATSTPAISQNGFVYSGYYGGFSIGGVVAVPVNNFTQAAMITIVSNTSSTDPEQYPVQSSPIVYSDTTPGEEVDYIYFTTNTTGGRGYCYYYDIGGGTGAEELWAEGGPDYALQGFAAENGYLVYGDDSRTLYIIR